MDFRRVKKKGQVQKVHKTWLSDCGMYRIDWRRELSGVRIKSSFHALVHTFRNVNETYKQWGFAGKRGSYKTYEAAVQACEHNRKCWTEAIEIASGSRAGRLEKLKTLDYQSRFRIIRNVKGKKTVVGRQKIMSSEPIWVRKLGNEALFTYFFPPIRGRRRNVEEEDDEDECPSVPTPVSSSSAPDSPGPTASSVGSSTPASPVKVEEKFSTPRRSASTKPEPSTTPALIAEAPGKAPAKRASKRTAKSSKTGGKKNSKRSTRTSSDKVPLAS